MRTFSKININNEQKTLSIKLKNKNIIVHNNNWLHNPVINKQKKHTVDLRTSRSIVA